MKSQKGCSHMLVLTIKSRECVNKTVEGSFHLPLILQANNWTLNSSAYFLNYFYIPSLLVNILAS